jgi:predicted HicB family RNase H-like nuclease
MNIMTINGYHAIIAYDEEIDMFRGTLRGQDCFVALSQKGFPGIMSTQ